MGEIIKWIWTYIVDFIERGEKGRHTENILNEVLFEYPGTAFPETRIEN